MRHVIQMNVGAATSLYVAGFNDEQQLVQSTKNVNEAKSFGSHRWASRWLTRHANCGYGLVASKCQVLPWSLTQEDTNVSEKAVKMLVSPKPILIAVCLGYWGRGDTVTAALKAMHKAGGPRNTSYYVLLMPAGTTKAWVDSMGYVCRDGGDPRADSIIVDERKVVAK